MLCENDTGLVLNSYQSLFISDSYNPRRVFIVNAECFRQNEKVFLEIQDDVVINSDIHGNLADLIYIFQNYGLSPKAKFSQRL